MAGPGGIRRGLGLSKRLIGAAAAASVVALLAGPGLIDAAAYIPPPSFRMAPPATPGVLTPPPPNPVPANCQQILQATPTQATKTFAGSTQTGTTTTYFFSITSPQADGNQTGLEDCAYANGDPSNIKYAAQASNPPFASHQVYTSLTVTTTDSICDRVAITNKDGTTDYTNLVGSSAGAADPNACQPQTVVPEAPAAGLILLVGLGVAGAAAFVWRRRHLGLVG
ncbi:MAG: hypothetical protein ACRDRD_14300 [Pseudonocardiaceae bacterium]